MVSRFYLALIFKCVIELVFTTYITYKLALKVNEHLAMVLPSKGTDWKGVDITGAPRPGSPLTTKKHGSLKPDFSKQSVCH